MIALAQTASYGESAEQKAKSVWQKIKFPKQIKDLKNRSAIDWLSEWLNDHHIHRQLAAKNVYPSQSRTWADHLAFTGAPGEVDSVETQTLFKTINEGGARTTLKRVQAESEWYQKVASKMNFSFGLSSFQKSAPKKVSPPKDRVRYGLVMKDIQLEKKSNQLSGPQYSLKPQYAIQPLFDQSSYGAGELGQPSPLSQPSPPILWEFKGGIGVDTESSAVMINLAQVQHYYEARIPLLALAQGTELQAEHLFRVPLGEKRRYLSKHHDDFTRKESVIENTFNQHGKYSVNVGLNHDHHDWFGEWVYNHLSGEFRIRATLPEEAPPAYELALVNHL